MESTQLTVGKLIEFLEKVRKDHGDNVPVYHVEFGGLTETFSVSLDSEPDKYDENENVKIVVLSG